MAARALGEAGQLDHAVSSEMLAGVLQRSASEGTLATGEASMLAEIVELGGTDVREIMTPRVDTLMLELDENMQRLAQMDRSLAEMLIWVEDVSALESALATALS